MSKSLVAIDNQRAARIFQEIAEFLELKGENPFKVRAYQRAARTISGMERPVGDLYADGTLTSVPGIGKAIAEKIEQLLKEGNIRLHEELAAEFPPQILDLMDVPGLGAKKAAALYQQLHVGSIPELEQAIAEGRVRELKGFGARTESRLLEGIRRMDTGERRLPLGQARKLVGELLARLREVPGVSRAEAAGSLRRWRETVGDLDLLCVAAEPGPVMEAFCGLVSADEVMMRGETRSSVRLPDGFQVDLRVVPASSFGAALQYFTGSKDHNVALRLRAERMGFKLNEYGLLAEDGSAVAGAEEVEIYARLGLPLIPPELRETGREIELAEAGRLPRLVDLEAVRGNLHGHSEWSDGSNTLEELAQEARARGYEFLAVTDHSRSLVIANGLTVERLQAQMGEIDALNRRLEGVRLLKGTECDILTDGSLDYPDDILAQLDLVVASVHTAFHLGKAEMTRRIIQAMENPHVDIIGHPSGRILNRRPGYELDWEAVFEAAARTRTALEINASPKRLDLPDVQARRARELGLMLAVNTDAHSLREFDFMPLGVSVARRAWLEPEQILNCFSLDRLTRWLRTREL